VDAGRAAVDTATINLGYTDVTAPVSGRIGLSQVTPGAFVQASQATLMATIQQLDPVYVDMAQSSVDGLKLRDQVQEGRLQTNGANAAKVTLMLEDGRTYPETGKLQFSDVSVNTGTGSVTVRAIFPNKKGTLLPGMFVRARIDEGINDKALVVPQIGVSHDARGLPTALVVGPDNKVATRSLVTSGTYGSNWVVESGLNPGDRVIVDGVDKAKPGSIVKTVPAVLPAPAADANGASAEGASAAPNASSSK
jgi:membrane fusion protein, multidrug efflux system